MFLLLPTLGMYASANERLLAIAKGVGITMFVSCIVTPPVTDPQRAVCDGLRIEYISALQNLNAPLPLIPSKIPSLYVLSPWDICGYEVTQLVFGKQTEVPYCPTVSM